jgi:YHS domain-containing protein
MLRYLLVLALIVIAARAFWRILDGVAEGLRGTARTPQAPQAPTTGVQMERDPVCGTFVVRDRAVTLAVGQRQLYFCSAGCRDKYRARPSTGSGRGEAAEGRIA